MTNYEYLVSLTEEQLANCIRQNILGGCHTCGEYLKMKCYYEDSAMLKWLEVEHEENGND